MSSRLLTLSLALSVIVFLGSAAFNYRLYPDLVKLEGDKLHPVAEVANLPGVPLYLIFADHLANRNDAAKMRNNALILLVSGTVGWSILTFLLVFTLRALFLGELVLKAKHL